MHLSLLDDVELECGGQRVEKLLPGDVMMMRQQRRGRWVARFKRDEHFIRMQGATDFFTLDVGENAHEAVQSAQYLAKHMGCQAEQIDMRCYSYRFIPAEGQRAPAHHQDQRPAANTTARSGQG